MGRNMDKNLEQRQKTKEKIENGALLYFAKYGLAGAKISDLAKFLGIAQGLLYRYYPSKEALFKEVCEKWIQQRDDGYLKLATSPLTAKEKIMRITENIKISLERDYRLAAIFTIFENESLAHGVAEGSAFAMWSKEPIEILARIIVQGQQEGDIHMGDAIQMSVTYWGLVFAMGHNQISSGTIASYDISLLNRLLIKNV